MKNSKLRIKTREIPWIMLFICSFLYSFNHNSVIMYIPFLSFLLSVLSEENSKVKNGKIIDLYLVSVILPDNYIIVFTSILVFLIKNRFAKRKSNVCWLVVVSLYIVLNIWISGAIIINALVYLIYICPIVLSFFSIKEVIKDDNFDIYKLTNSVKRIIVLQLMSIAIYGLININKVMTYKDMDWVTGTFGEYQCNVLMCVCSFFFLFFLCQYLVTKKIDKVGLFGSAILLISTTSISYMIIFFLSLISVWLFSLRISLKKKIVIECGLVILTFVFSSIAPEWIIREFSLLTDKGYFIRRVSKLRFYENTFLMIPKNEGIFRFVFGNGIGQYVSRAAETCGGGYIDFYDKYFPIYNSYIRNKYIINAGFGGVGLADTAQSSVLALQGEFGVIGLLAVCKIFSSKLRVKNPISKVCILFFVGLMLIENVLEFGKYGVVLWIVYYVSQEMSKVTVKATSVATHSYLSS